MIKSRKVQWCLFIIISRASKWGTLKKARETRDAQFLQKLVTLFALIGLGPARPGRGCASVPHLDACQSVAILMNRRHWKAKESIPEIRCIRGLRWEKGPKLSQPVFKKWTIKVKLSSHSQCAATNKMAYIRTGKQFLKRPSAFCSGRLSFAFMQIIISDKIYSRSFFSSEGSNDSLVGLIPIFYWCV